MNKLDKYAENKKRMISEGLSNEDDYDLLATSHREKKSEKRLFSVIIFVAIVFIVLALYSLSQM